ncbi:MAG: cyclic nucleotide-binding domain-containing protein [Patescibacteria group bacterium]|nr:cyclic nucleotide-binding domain-containing protein [Patescibacteria group bacterium]MDD5490916.1 cyclic nucleotide-binding domain-containing protein [Patescibacteria group bacterium]
MAKQEIKIFKNGEILFGEGTEADKIFFLKKGIVELYKGAEQTESNLRASFIVNPERDGSTELIIGASDFLSKGKYFYTARVRKYAEIVVIERKELKSLFKNNPQDFMRIVFGLINEAHSARSQLETVIKNQNLTNEQSFDFFCASLAEERKDADDIQHSLLEMFTTLAGVKVTNVKPHPQKNKK